MPSEWSFKLSPVRWGVTASLVAALCFAQEKGEGPAMLVLSYKCRPETRTAFRDHMEKTGAAQFERWKKQGVFAEYQLLFSSYVNASSWDMLAVLSFDKYVDQARWREIERRMPGGLAYWSPSPAAAAASAPPARRRSSCSGRSGCATKSWPKSPTATSS